MMTTNLIAIMMTADNVVGFNAGFVLHRPLNSRPCHRQW